MGFLKIFSTAKGEETGHLARLVSGSLTVDSEGSVIASTIPSTFPQAHLRAIIAEVLAAFRGARKAEMPLTDIVITFLALKVTARELRGGAIIFLAPEPPK